MSRRRKQTNVVGNELGITGKIVVYVLVGFLLFQGMTKGYAFGYELFNPKAVSGAPGVEKQVTIQEGASASQVAKTLKTYGLITNEYIFILQDKFFDYTIHPGTYTLTTAMTSRDMLELFNEVQEDEQ